MSERRVIVSLTREQAQCLVSNIYWFTQIHPDSILAVAVAELESALAIYDLTQSTVSRVAAVPTLDAASLTEHAASSADPYRYPERGE